MEILTGDHVSKAVDYSFGDHFSIWDKTLPDAFTKEANINNQEFIDQAKEFRGKIMTLYIDNLRLYPRPVKTDTDYDKYFVGNLMLTNNLLAMCSLLPANGFIIYTGQEDTPIDEYIGVPPNVLQVYAVNAVYNNDQITPFPFGLQRQMNPDDNRLGVMKSYVYRDEKRGANKLFYINMGIGRNPERAPLAEFKDNDWVTTRFNESSKFFPYSKYTDFLEELWNHKFIACPPGHGMDTHRIWETMYMRRVPVIKEHPYFRKLLAGFPVLYVNNWYDVTHALLEENEHLFQEAQTMDLGRLNLTEIMKGHRERHAHP